MNISSFAVDFSSFLQHPLPVFCFPEFIEKLPFSLSYCFVYLLGCGIVMGIGFYFYYKRWFELKFLNGHANDQLYFEAKSKNENKLHWLFCCRSNSKNRNDTEMALFNGDK
jgi:hypothetical protein